MVSDHVRPFRSLTVFSNNSAALPIAGLRGPGRTALVWRSAGRSLQSLSRLVSLERSRVTYFLGLLTCGIVIGVIVGGFVGFMENATPHGVAPGSIAQMATADAGWAAMMRQTGAPSNVHLQRLAARSHRPIATGSYVGWQPVAEASDSRSVVCVGQH